MVVKTSSDEKQRKRYGSLNRNEFRREEDDDVSKRTDFGGHEIRVRGHSIIGKKNFTVRLSRSRNCPDNN